MIDNPIEIARSCEHVGLAIAPAVRARAATALLDQARRLLASTHERTRCARYGRAWFDARVARRRLHRAAAAPTDSYEDLAALVDELTCVGAAMRSRPWGAKE